MPWRRVSLFVVGLCAGIVLWTVATPRYNVGVAAVAEVLLKLDPRTREVELVASDKIIRISPRDTTKIPAGYIPAAELTLNVILLLALFVSNRAPWRLRNLRNLALATFVLCAVHPVAVAVTVESTLASKVGEWSEKTYSELSANIFLATEMFYRVVGMYALPFVLWWVGEQTRRVGRVVE